MDLLTKKAVCHLLGGTQPIDSATLYRWIRKGRMPKPIKLSPGTSRWLKAEVEAVLAEMAEDRGDHD
jgi:predicted DNA-binding transcriptional regulator AlpA